MTNFKCLSNCVQIIDEKPKEEEAKKPYVAMKRCRMLRSGVQYYSADEIPAEFVDKLGKKDYYSVYRRPEAVVKHVKEFNYLFFTDGHPAEGFVNPYDKCSNVVGRIGGSAELKVLDDGNVYVENDVIFDSEKAYKEFCDGKVEMSIGMGGVWQISDSPEYDIEVIELKNINHCALVPAGRAGAMARILDSGGKKMKGILDIFGASKDEAKKKEILDSVALIRDKAMKVEDNELLDAANKLCAELGVSDASFGEKKEEEKPEAKKDESVGEEKEKKVEDADDVKKEEKKVDDSCGCDKKEGEVKDACGEEKKEEKKDGEGKVLDAGSIRAIVAEEVAKAMAEGIKKAVKAELGICDSAVGADREASAINSMDFELPFCWGGR